MSFKEALMRELTERLRAKGLVVRTRSYVQGLSGIEHYFDLIAENPRSGKQIVLTVKDRADCMDVIGLLAARLDLSVPHVLIAKEVENGVTDVLRSLGITIIMSKEVSYVVDEKTARISDLVLDNIVSLLP